MLGHSGFWGGRGQIPPSPWVNWTDANNGSLFGMSTDVFGGPNNNQFNACMLTPSLGLATWASRSGAFEHTYASFATNGKLFRAFKVNGTTINVEGNVLTYSQTNLNANVTMPFITAVDSVRAVASCSVYLGSFAYTTYFQLLQVDPTTSNVTLAAAASTSTRVNEQCYMGSGRLLVSMESGSLLWLSWTATDIVVRSFTTNIGFTPGRLYRLDDTTVAVVGTQTSNSTRHLKIYRIVFDATLGSTLTELSSYPLNQTNQDVIFLTPTRFVTVWGSGPYTVAELSVTPAFQIVQTGVLTTSLSFYPSSAGPTGTTLDGATAILQYQVAGVFLQARVIDFGSTVNVRPWWVIGNAPAYFNSAHGVVPIDTGRCLFNYTDTAYTAGQATGWFKVLKL